MNPAETALSGTAEKIHGMDILKMGYHCDRREKSFTQKVLYNSGASKISPSGRNDNIKIT